MSKIYIRTCNVCGQQFERDHKGRKARICSPECLQTSYKDRLAHLHKRAEYTCQYCHKQFTERTCRNSKYCSVACRKAGVGAAQKGSSHTSLTVHCEYCNRPIRRFKSRTKKGARMFCDSTCYHKWDSWYKSQPDQRYKHVEHLLKQSQRSSQIEQMVADWLSVHGLAYERQVSVIHKTMDFKVGDTFIEVQGCYWHGCPDCFILHTPKQRKVQSRDKAKATYCKRRGVPLITIWEHDIRANNFIALAPLVS